MGTEHTTSAGDVAGADVTYRARGDYGVIEKSLVNDYFAAERARIMAGGRFVP